MTTEFKQVLAQTGIDAESGIERFMGNEGLFEKFLRRFPADPSYSELVQALEAGETERAFEAAHTMKGVCGNLSMTRLYALVSEVVEQLRDGKPDAARALMPEVTQVYRAITAILGV